MFNPKQPGRLWDGELKPRHFVEFTSDSIDKCARVHDVGSLVEDVLSGPVLGQRPESKQDMRRAVPNRRGHGMHRNFGVLHGHRVSAREHSRSAAEHSQQHCR